ncbi:MAG: MFS transporter [Desulfurococcales archaeon]|nr:MFS transporter [Desulfurococcales archaeon]
MNEAEASYGRLSLIALAQGLAMGLAWAIVAPFLRELGYTGTEYGAMGGSAVLTSSLLTIASGILSDVFGAKPLALIGILGASASLQLIASGEKLLVAAGFMAQGASMGLGMTAWTTLVSRSVDDSKLHYAMSYVQSASTFGVAIGSFLGFAPVAYSRHTGIPLVEAYSLTLRVAGVLVLLSAPLILGVKERRSTREGRTSRPGLRDARRMLRGKFLVLATVNIMVGFGAAMSIHNIDYYFAAKYGITSAELGGILGLQQIVMALLMRFMPGLADRYGGLLRIYLAVTTPSIPLLIAMTLTNNLTLAASLYIIRSILMNVANPLYTAKALSLVPLELRGSASGILSLSWSLPASAGRAVGGYLLDLNVELPLRLTALIYTTSLIFLAYKFRDELGRRA